MRAYLLERPGAFGFGEVEPFDVPAQWISVAPTFIGLCGSDLHIYDGVLPAVTYPVALGHEIVGIAQNGEHAGRLVAIDPVEGCGRCDRCRAGTENICAQVGIVGVNRDGGLAERVVVRPDRVFAVPEGVPPALAAVTEALAVAVHAVGRVEITGGDVVAVLGGGPIGMLTAIVARDAGAARVVVTEPAPLRRALAGSLGFEAIDPVRDGGGLARALGSRRADVLFDCAAAPSLPPTLSGFVRSGGTIVVVGVYEDLGSVNLNDVVRREITLAGTRALSSRDTPAALEIIRRRPDELSALVDATLPPEGMHEALERLRRGEAMKVLIDCSELSGV